MPGNGHLLLFCEIMQENWKDIIGFEGLYQVSDMGRVKSLERFIFKKMYGGGLHCYKRKERIKKFDIVRDYCTVELSKASTKERFKVHRLVATAFIPNPENKPVVNHIDNSPLNNCVTNLEWCTHKENIAHCVSQGRHKGIVNMPLEKRIRKGSSNNMAKLNEQQVIEIRSLKLSQRKIASIYKVSRTAIKLIQQRKNWAHV